ncbi:aquaporin Z [Evansella vedderi]|uniref:Aquaporin Z n=1 Tax=Evansella vedderi TaxID=38282 RepID=A0ABT9ZQH8_9BACI|nr:aquaporin [Evansella vedderi]MDQ0252698.1 aquaporin Z [Evansella vedderi]
MKKGMIKKKLIAEFIGTYFLIFAVTGAIVINALTESITHVGIALTSGLVVMALIYTFGHISGAHFNPAVTIGFFVNGDIHKKEAVPYILTQVVAGIAASATLLMLFGNVAYLGATLPRFSWEQSFVLEFILTFILMMVIFGSAIHGKAVKSFAGVAIGATVGLEAMFAGPISGASMNPARSIGPAIVSGNMEYLWIYIVATILGAIAAALVYKTLHE